MSITRPTFNRTTIATLLATTLTAGLIGCSSDDASTTSAIDGSVFASSVGDASCEFQDSLGETIKGPFVTTTAGTYSVVLPNASLKEDLMLVCTGGSYTDEATGTTDVAAGTMAAYVAADTLGHGSSVHATPGSTIVQQMVTAASPRTLTQAEEVFNTAFGYTPDTSIAPTDATDPDVDATDEELLAGLRAAAFSQLTEDLGLNPADQFALLDALVKDLADNDGLDGNNGGGDISIQGTATKLSVDIQNLFATAFLNFHDNPISDTDVAGNDNTGLTTDKIGTLPFGKVALTSSYQVEYVEGMMSAMHGKTQFQISITDPSNSDAPVTGAGVTLMPMMYMATKSHSTAVDGACMENGTPGTYDCTVYYVMPSMGGYWDLKVMIGGMMGESANFYPEVMMAMGDTPMAKLKNDNFTMNMMGTISPRSFLPFKSSLTGTTGAHTFELYTATMETMMTFPAIYDSVILNAATMNELTINPMEVLVSTDPAFMSDVVTATSSSDGYWTAAGITGLTNSVEGKLYVQMTINGHVLNSSPDGVLVDDTVEPPFVFDEYATFTVTPKMAMP